MTAGEVTDALFRYFRASRGYRYQLCNAYVWDWESDFFCLSSSGYAYDIEVKVSRSDYKADFNKTRRHRILGWPHDTYVKKTRVWGGATNYRMYPAERFRDGLYYSKDGKTGRRPPQSTISYQPLGQVCPNRFLYAAPQGMLSPEEVPHYAGLVSVAPDGRRKPSILKKPPVLHTAKRDFTEVLLDKYYFAYLRSLGRVRQATGFDFPDNPPNGKLRRR